MLKYLALALALPLLIAVPSAPAAAGDWDWAVGSGGPDTGHRAKARMKRRSAARVMAYQRRAGDGDRERSRWGDGWQCLEKVRGLGTQWIGTEGAMEAAKKDWMERVRYDHGESYIDMTNARDFESRCGRTSIGEVAGQVTYRCEIMARPCKAPMREVKKAN